MADPARALERALLDLAGKPTELLSSRDTPWASSSFSGTRHFVTIALAGADAAERADLLKRILPDHEFALPGHIVIATAAETAPDGNPATLAIEAVLIEED